MPHRLAFSRHTIWTDRLGVCWSSGTPQVPLRYRSQLTPGRQVVQAICKLARVDPSDTSAIAEAAAVVKLAYSVDAEKDTGEDDDLPSSIQFRIDSSLALRVMSLMLADLAFRKDRLSAASTRAVLSGNSSGLAADAVAIKAALGFDPNQDHDARDRALASLPTSM